MTAVLAAVLAVAGVVVARDVDRSERQVLDDRLRRTAELWRATAVAAVQQELPGADRRLDAVLSATRSSLRLAIGDAVLLSSGDPAPQGRRPPLGLHTISVGGRRYRTYAETLRDPSLGGLARLEVTTGLDGLERRQAALRRRLAGLGALLLLVAGAGVWLAADLVLRPLRRLRTATAGIATEGDLDRPVPVAGPAELRGLAGSFNAMLARLSRSAEDRNRALEATRRFAADAGHELRTPLTSVHATLSAIARHPGMPAAQRGELARDALHEQRRLVELLDSLQALARGDAAPVELADVDLAEVLDASAGAAAARHPGLALSTHAPDEAVALRGWESGLRILLDNLIENAARHGRPGGEVRVTLHAAVNGAGPAIEVEDDGRGIPPAERERVLEPFHRVAGTERAGSGLGLALVAQQARLHGAEVTVGDSALGGARVCVGFPAAQDP
ncbi:MAG TPA: HAMP domain-containing sensor histidine kinase [Solirubrobacteraceae bacterium]|nr:HAMP domain-containing sensor histidine kinase [Solirubrobacteraceae bacterium]